MTGEARCNYGSARVRAYLGLERRWGFGGSCLVPQQKTGSVLLKPIQETSRNIRAWNSTSGYAIIMPDNICKCPTTETITSFSPEMGLQDLGPKLPQSLYVGLKTPQNWWYWIVISGIIFFLYIGKWEFWAGCYIELLSSVMMPWTLWSASFIYPWLWGNSILQFSWFYCSSLRSGGP